jgi:hypothetical protein
MEQSVDVGGALLRQSRTFPVSLYPEIGYGG